jgi:hypothetical protein
MEGIKRGEERREGTTQTNHYSKMVNVLVIGAAGYVVCFLSYQLVFFSYLV